MMNRQTRRTFLGTAAAGAFFIPARTPARGAFSMKDFA